MKKIVRITESDLNRIVKKVLNEQKYGQTIVMSNDPSVKEIRQTFNEYLKEKVPYTNDTTYYERSNELKKYITSTSKDNELEDVTEFFKNKGYKMLNDKIKKFQEELMVKNFRTKDGKESEFTDGVFGVATAKASIKYEVMRLNRMVNSNGKDYTYGDNLASYQEMVKKKKEGKLELTDMAKEKPTKISNRPKTDTQKIGVGTQSYN